MSKMNPPLRMKKAITGYKSIRPVKGDDNTYTVETNAGPTEASVLNSSQEIVGIVEGVNLKDVMQKVREGLVSLGVKFPILQAADVPFETESVFNLSYDPVPPSLDFVAGGYTLEYNGNSTTQLLIGASDADIQTALQAIEGLEETVVTGDFFSGFVITIPVPGVDLTLDTNTLSYEPKVQELMFGFDPLTRELISGQYTLTDGTNTTSAIQYNDDFSAVDSALNGMGYACSVQAIVEEGQTVGFTITSIPGTNDLSEDTNTLESDLIGSPGTPEPVSITITDVSPAPEAIDVVLAV